ncbi:MAG TPA: hypothetical protein PK867_02220, partial [Pirellulales bacterium]|nr:hypothetical protein [Pirellulales bacterium]
MMLVENLLFPGAVTIALATAIKSSPAYLADRDGQDAGPAWQFTIGQLLIFTSAVAVMIVLFQQLLKGSLMLNPRLVIAEGAQIGVVVAVWSALPRRWRRLRLAAGAVVACGVGLVVQSFMSADWFWDVLRKFPNVRIGELWGDLLS